MRRYTKNGTGYFQIKLRNHPCHIGHRRGGYGSCGREIEIGGVEGAGGNSEGQCDELIFEALNVLCIIIFVQ